LPQVEAMPEEYSPKVIITGMREDYENNDKLEYSKNIININIFL